MATVYNITFIGNYLILDALDAFDASNCSAWRHSNDFGDGDEAGQYVVTHNGHDQFLGTRYSVGLWTKVLFLQACVGERQLRPL